MMKKDALRQSANLLMVIATIVINGLANALPLNAQTTGEISDRFQVYLSYQVPNFGEALTIMAAKSLRAALDDVATAHADGWIAS